MIAEGDEPALLHGGREPLHLLGDAPLALRQDAFVEAAHDQEVLSVLLAVPGGVRSPGTDLDGKHAVDPGVEPEGEQLVDLSVAVDVDHVDVVAVQRVDDAPVMGDHHLLEGSRRDQGPAAVAHVLPQVGRLRPHAELAAHLLDDRDREVGPGLDDLLEELRVVIDDLGDPLQAEPVALSSVEGARVDGDRVVSLRAGPLIQPGLPHPLGPDPPRMIGAHARLVVLLPALAILEQMIEVLGDGAHDLSALQNHPVPVAHDLRLPLVFQHLLVEDRKEIHDPSAQARPIHAEEVVRRRLLPDGRREAVLLPDQQGLFPEAEIADRTAVHRPVVHGAAEAFSVVHSRSLPGGARRIVTYPGKNRASLPRPRLLSEKGRVPDGRQLTLFKSVGNAVQDLAAAAVVLEEARRLGLGTEVAL